MALKQPDPVVDRELDEAEAWLEYLEACQFARAREASYTEVEEWAWVRLQRRLKGEP